MTKSSPHNNYANLLCMPGVTFPLRLTLMYGD
jgi:hypothetical protein